MICGNCGKNADITDLSFVTEKTPLVAMSDGSLTRKFSARQKLCNSCGVIFTEYQPHDRLAQYFKNEYNVSDIVQNCQVVIDDIKHEKHSVIHKSILDETNTIPSSGSFLEIACGEGNLSRKFAEKHADWKCFGVDPSSSANLESTIRNLSFIRDYFKPETFKDQKFDVVIAHGILNRIPTLKNLKAIQSILKDGALLSLEVVTLEGSVYAPHIWDHSYTYLEETFVDFLQSLGIMIYKKVDCGSTIQLLCKYDESQYTGFQAIKKTVAERTFELYKNHLKSWSMTVEKFNSYSNSNNGKEIIIFGAGLYSAVLTSLIGPDRYSHVIDELREGSMFAGKKVHGLESDINKDNSVIFLCCRKRNEKYLTDKLRSRGFKVLSLI